jgi:hypothetical protein
MDEAYDWVINTNTNSGLDWDRTSLYGGAQYWKHLEPNSMFKPNGYNWVVTNSVFNYKIPEKVFKFKAGDQVELDLLGVNQVGVITIVLKAAYYPYQVMLEDGTIIASNEKDLKLYEDDTELGDWI